MAMNELMIADFTHQNHWWKKKVSADVLAKNIVRICSNFSIYPYDDAERVF